jgi:hypothetical protein
LGKSCLVGLGPGVNFVILNFCPHSF